jgi:hypothetical protein
MREARRRAYVKVVVVTLLGIAVAIGIQRLAERRFGPYEHWTLWARLPIVIAIFVAWISVVWWDVRRRSRHRRGL